MKQMTQKLKDGKVRIIECPVPPLLPGRILVKTFYSLISAGTEGDTVKTARKSYIGKAKARPRQVKQVLDTLRSQGPMATYRAVMKKLDAHSSIGYSMVGEVLDVGDGVSGFRSGDIVACGGKTACHAEIVSVPELLAVKVPQAQGGPHTEEQLQAAAYNTLGAIAMQGVRQAVPSLGENTAVIGLGLLGQLICLLLRAAGIGVVGLDINPSAVKTASEKCCDLALDSKDPAAVSQVFDFTGGLGCDSVIIAAGTSSLAPINLAGAISRHRGTVVVLGAVPTGFDREPHYYQKELSLKMSCSYGPGRYDPVYEDKGHDYPPGYVRWTENRNMQAFQQLIGSGKLDLSYLTTHTFELDNAPRAYDMILAGTTPFKGILISYDRDKTHRPGPLAISKSGKSAHVTAGFIGAGSYCQSHLLPNLPGGVTLDGVSTSSSETARSAADRFGFRFASGNTADVINAEQTNTVFIATRHDSHGRYVLDALKAGRHVFVEKPLCIDTNEFEEIRKLYKDLAETGNPPQLMVGFNRTFAPLTRKMREKLPGGPHAILYRINAGSIPGNSWIQDMEVGGGRILGEVCHFVDYCACMTDSRPKTVAAASMADPAGHNDTLSVNLEFENGSVAAICYFANGAGSLPKEYIEVNGHGKSFVLDDFRELRMYGASGKPEIEKLAFQDKGQKNQMKAFIKAVQKGDKPVIAPERIFSVTEACFAILESLRTGRTIIL